MRPHVIYLWADIQQNRFDLLERCFLAANHEREVPLFKGDDAARNGRIEHVSAFFGDLTGYSFGGGRADGTHVNIHFARTETGQYTMFTAYYLVKSGGICHHRKNDIGCLCNGRSEEHTSELQS